MTIFNSSKGSLIILFCGMIITAFIAHVLYNRYSAFNMSQKIYGILDHYRISYDIDARSIDPNIGTTPLKISGVEQCIDNIAYFVQNNIPMTMLLVSFPFKAGNVDKKVLGSLPDMAERKSLEYLQNIVNEIKAIYKPGAKILIFCDGAPFAEYFGIPLADVNAYEQKLRVLSEDLPDIKLYTSEDMVNEHHLSSIAEIPAYIDQYEPSDLTFRAELKTIPSVVLKRVALDLDYPQGKKMLAEKSLSEIVTGLLSREARLRTYIMHTYPSPAYFRLTVHFSPDISKKFGIKLSPTSDITPYHGVMVQDGVDWSIRFKKDIDMNEFTYATALINGHNYGYYTRKK